MTNQLGNILDVDSGVVHICALEDTGIVQCWGANYYGQLGNDSQKRSTDPEIVKNLTNAQQLAVGKNHTCVLVPPTDLQDSGIRCWGLNTDGQLGDGTNNNSLAPVVVK